MQCGQRRKLGLDLVPAVAAGAVLEQLQPLLRGPDLELALVGVLEVLRRPHDHVDDRPDEREQRRGRRAADQHRVVEPAARVRVGPIDQREPDHEQKEDEQVDDQVEAVVLDAK